jgi:hypothetical protein
MTPDVSVLYLKDPATGPYAESDEPSPPLLSNFFNINYNIILTSMSRSSE